MTTTIRWGVSRTTRRVLLIIHLVSGLGLMGYLLTTTLVRVAVAADPVLRDSALYGWYRQPLTPIMGGSMTVLVLTTGILLGLASRWGVLRYGWVVTKLVLLVAVLVAAFTAPEVWATSAAQWGALLTATILSVVKPAPRRRSGSPARVAVASGSVIR